MPIRAVIFDMGGVLIPAHSPFVPYYEKKYQVGREALGTMFNLNDIVPLYQCLERGEISAEEFVELLAKEYATAEAPTPVDVSMTIVEFFHSAGLDPLIPIMWQAARSLKANGTKMAVLSNNFFIDRSRSKTILPIDTTLFDLVVESSRVGIRKPDPRIFHLTLEKLQCTAEETVFLDDNLENVEGARAVGITAIRVSAREPEKAVEELEKLIGINLRLEACL